MTAIDTAITDPREAALRLFARNRTVALAVPTVLMPHLVYIFFAFDVPGLAQRAKLDNAVILLSDAVSYKIHVTRDNRSDTLAVSVEGSRRAVFPEARIPDWIAHDGARTVIDLTGGHVVI